MTYDAVRPVPDGEECVRPAQLRAVPVQPSPETNTRILHCSISYSTAGRDEDVVRRASGTLQGADDAFTGAHTKNAGLR